METNPDGSRYFKQIVAGTDGSETAAVALRRAIALASSDGAMLTVVSAYARSPVHVAQEDQVPRDVRHEVGAREDVNMILATATSEARRAGVEVKTAAVRGGAAEAILDLAGRVDADLIVVGSKGMSGTRRYLLGSVPNSVSHHAHCSVMIVHTC
ncbi:MAG: UspA domain protein [Solirubrobacterales bacterium]|nr:UspA domain protein [Solirubrobacterales bacterium]